MNLKTACFVLLLLLGFPAGALAQRPDEKVACCRIVRFDAAKEQWIARETSTGYTFRFVVRNRRARGLLRIGEPVWADFSTKTVRIRVDEVQPCCAIIETPAESNAAVRPKPPER